MAKDTCIVGGCALTVVSYRRCYRHRPEMTAADLAEAKADVRARRSTSMTGDKNPQYGKCGQQHRLWKGDEAGYMSIHSWMERHYGSPKVCEDCHAADPDGRYEWANISGEYRRDRSDFKRLCKRCHNNFDGVNIKQQDAPPEKNQPMRQYGGSPCSSRYKGVRASGYGTWLATLTVRGERRNLGRFKTQEDAARAYNAAVIEAYGESAYTNEVP